MMDPDAPQAFLTITPYIVVRDATEAINFYQRALGAGVRDIARTAEGKVMNAQLVIGDSVLMLNDEFPDYGSFAPGPEDRIFVTLHLRSYAIDADFQRAVDAGASVTMPLENQFWGDRYGQFRDPYGYTWSMGQPLSELT